MKIKFLVMLFIMSSCNTDLIGEIDINDLKKFPHKSWFVSEYDNYEPYDDTMEKLKPLINKYDILLFMGTWCEDSQTHVPTFLKVISQLDFKNELRIIGVDLDKKTPTGIANNYEIEYVPTFIFVENGKEVNRIVEFPVDFIEDDILAICKDNNYKNVYEL